MQRLRDVLFLLMVGLFMASGQFPVATFYSLEQCDAVCGPAEDCDKPCLVDLFENTCGGYGGPPIDPIAGNCLGECGDTFCNSFNGEDAATCWEDCGACGDWVCSGPENLVGSQFYCCLDCHSNPNECVGPGGPCDDEPGVCGMGETCNKGGTCCPVGLWFVGVESDCSWRCNGSEDCVNLTPEWPTEQQWACVASGGACSSE